jgi:hypothetical protein
MSSADPEKLPTALGEYFGFRAGDEHVASHLDLQAAERGGTDDVLERFASAAPSNHFAHLLQFFRAQRTFKLQVKSQAWKF